MAYFFGEFLYRIHIKKPKTDHERIPIFEDIDLCGNNWDAVLLCRQETFFFSDRRMWRINSKVFFIITLIFFSSDPGFLKYFSA